MNPDEKQEKVELAATNATKQHTLEDEIASLTSTLRRWRFSVLYITAAVTIAVILQLYIIVER